MHFRDISKFVLECGSQSFAANDDELRNEFVWFFVLCSRPFSVSHLLLIRNNSRIGDNIGRLSISVLLDQDKTSILNKLVSNWNNKKNMINNLIKIVFFCSFNINAELSGSLSSHSHLEYFLARFIVYSHVSSC